jgi:hypothetical protein
VEFIPEGPNGREEAQDVVVGAPGRDSHTA